MPTGWALQMQYFTRYLLHLSYGQDLKVSSKILPLQNPS